MILIQLEVFPIELIAKTLKNKKKSKNIKLEGRLLNNLKYSSSRGLLSHHLRRILVAPWSKERRQMMKSQIIFFKCHRKCLYKASVIYTRLHLDLQDLIFQKNLFLKVFRIIQEGLILVTLLLLIWSILNKRKI